MSPLYTQSHDTSTCSSPALATPRSKSQPQNPYCVLILNPTSPSSQHIHTYTCPPLKSDPPRLTQAFILVLTSPQHTVHPRPRPRSPPNIYTHGPSALLPPAQPMYPSP